ncbi:MAG: diaminopimelate decarboxylase [Eubacteriales bacterium]|nr:diaminopimelate decarboxylase [Eubacteriales bacterium]
MTHWGNLSINEKGHLILGGCDAIDLAARFGTPLYVMEEDTIRGVCRGYVRAINGYPGGGKALFAGKAFLITAMCKIIESEGLGLDVVSGGELYVAMNAGFDLKNVYLHGNNKTPEDLRMAVKAGIGRIVIDSANEIGLLAGIAKELGRIQDVSVRIKPGIEAHTHEYIKTGQVDSKFGFGIGDGQGMRAVRDILAQPSLSLIGLHCHIGSQIFELQPFRDAVDVMLNYMLKVEQETGFVFSEINFGGGYGIHYTAEDAPLRPDEYVKTMLDELTALCNKKGVTPPFFVIEPGRSIVGEAGTTLYTVGDIKTIPDIRTYVSVDGSMADNPRPALYQAVYTCALAGKMDAPEETVVSIAGRTCESGDMLIWNAKLPETQAGDVLAVFSTGAYNYSMASNYNKLPHPAVVLVKDGRAELMVKRQSYDDLIKNDVIPSWL